MPADLEHTDRGFAIYGRVTDDRGTKVRVQESSVVDRPHAYVFAEGDTPGMVAPHLTVDQAKELILALERFVAHAEDPDNWRNNEKYKRAWG